MTERILWSLVSLAHRETGGGCSICGVVRVARWDLPLPLSARKRLLCCWLGGLCRCTSPRTGGPLQVPGLRWLCWGHWPLQPAPPGLALRSQLQRSPRDPPGCPEQIWAVGRNENIFNHPGEIWAVLMTRMFT